MIDTILMSFLIVFLAGFRQLITKARPDLEWIAVAAFATVPWLVWCIVVGVVSIRDRRRHPRVTPEIPLERSGATVA